MSPRRELDHFVLDVELVLISVVQGVALSTLALASAPLLRTHRLEPIAFTCSGLAFVLSFWAVSLVHALSFVRWPMDLGRYFFYFALALAECLTFLAMDHARDWFGWSLACFAITALLYAYDERAIRSRRLAFGDGPARRALFEHVLGRQRLEGRVLVPAGVAFSALAWLLAARWPASIPALALAQLACTIGFLASFVRGFGERQRRIAAVAAGDRDPEPHAAPPDGDAAHGSW